MTALWVGAKSFGREEIHLAEGRVTRKKRKSERAVPGTFDVVFFIISTHDSVFFDLLSFFYGYL